MSGPYAFPHGGGAMGTLVRAHDWSASPLGPVAAWPAALRVSVDNVLASAFPAFVAWSEQQILVYNDACAARRLERHPATLGQPCGGAWPELRDVPAASRLQLPVHPEGRRDRSRWKRPCPSQPTIVRLFQST